MKTSKYCWKLKPIDVIRISGTHALVYVQHYTAVHSVVLTFNAITNWGVQKANLLETESVLLKDTENTCIELVHIFLHLSRKFPDVFTATADDYN